MKTRVLFADEDAAQREACRSFLEGCGYDVETARDAVDCVTKLVEKPPAVVVLSRGLLWGGAAGVLARMRDGEPKVPVVLTAGRDSSIEPDALNGDPVVACLQGPLRLIELLKCLIAAENVLPNKR